MVFIDTEQRSLSSSTLTDHGHGRHIKSKSHPARDNMGDLFSGESTSECIYQIQICTQGGEGEGEDETTLIESPPSPFLMQFGGRSKYHRVCLQNRK